MNHDQLTISTAYDEAIIRFYAALVIQFTDAAGVPAQEQIAEQNFMKGVGTARHARDRALALLA